MEQKTKKQFSEILKTFILSLGILMFATSKINFIPNLLNTLGVENEVVENTLISIIITASIEVVKLLSSWLFAKVKVEMSTHVNGSERSEIVFKPTSDSEYEKEYVKIRLIISTPANFLTYLVKKLNLSLEIYFNPEILDISFENEWDHENLNNYKMDGRKIRINLLEDIIIGGKLYSKQPHNLNIPTMILPIRIEEKDTNLDYTVVLSKKNSFYNFFTRFLIDVDSKSLMIKCEGGD